MLASNTTVFISWSQFYVSCAAFFKFHYFPDCKSFFPSSHVQKQHQDSCWPSTCTTFWSERCGRSYLQGILEVLACILGCILCESSVTPGAWALVCGTFKATHVYRQNCHEALESRMRNLWQGRMVESETFIKGRKWLGFQKARLHPAVRSSDQVEGRKGAGRRSANLSPGGPGGQIGNPVHSFFSSPLCIIRTANRIHAAATVVSY